MLFLSHCSVSPLHASALAALMRFNEHQQREGVLAFEDFAVGQQRFREGFASLLRTEAENISFTCNSTAAINQLAQSYPFRWRDHIISYAHEFPANYHPWALVARQKGLKLLTLPNAGLQGQNAGGSPLAWRFSDLEKLCSRRTRLIALSHVQYTSGFAADLERLAAFCRSRGIDLVIDAAQSMGALPLEPERLGIDAIVASGWKFLLGPHGSGVFYTSAKFRSKLGYASAGPMMMRQEHDYADLSWQPRTDARRFEASTPPASLVLALAAVAQEYFASRPISEIRDRIFAHLDRFVEELDRDKYQPIEFPPEARSAILPVRAKRSTHEIVVESRKRGLILTERGGYLRLAPHAHSSGDEISEAIAILNEL